MGIRFQDCYITQTDVRHDAYKKKNPVSGRDEDRVKIKTSQVRDCRRVNITNEAAEESDDEELELLVDDEKSEEKQEDEGSQTMEIIMENFRRFQEKVKTGN